MLHVRLPAGIRSADVRGALNQPGKVVARGDLITVESDSRLGCSITIDLERSSAGFSWSVVDVRLTPLNAADFRFDEIGCKPRVPVAPKRRPTSAPPAAIGDSTSKYHGRIRSVVAARHVALAVARLLPRRNQARYSAEWQSELHEIATTGASRARQILYALHLFNSVFVLRADLKSAKRRVSS
jgi:hypothetical protein